MKTMPLPRLFAFLLIAAALAQAASAANCGGVTPCSCGDTLILSRALTPADPVTTGVCAGDYALRIDASNIFLDCSWRMISGQRTGIGLLVYGRSGITVRNCVVANFMDNINLTLVNDTTITSNSILNATYGLTIGGSALRNQNNVISYNGFNNGTNGAFLQYANKTSIYSNTFSNMSTSLLLRLSPNMAVTGNYFSGSHHAVELDRANGTLAHNYISNATIGIWYLTDKSTSESITVSNTTILLKSPYQSAIILESKRPMTVGGTFSFVKTTIAALLPGLDKIGINNVALTSTFTDTNFTDYNVSLFYPTFSLTNNPGSVAKVLDSTDFFVGSTVEFNGRIFAVYPPTLNDLNRRANVSVSHIDCNSFGIFYNQSYQPDGNGLRSAPVAYAGSGFSFCVAPASCTEIRCNGAYLTFNVPSWSTYAVRPATGDISGTVSACTGGALHDAYVWLFNGSNSLVGTRITDSTGYYQFMGLTWGNYTVVANFTGNTNARRNLTLNKFKETRNFNAGEICPLASDCTADCTLRGKDRCEPSCNGVNGCVFQFGLPPGPSCEGRRAGLKIYFDATREAVCCTRDKYIKKTTGVEIGVPGQNVVKMTSIVNFKDAYKYIVGAKMNVVVFQKRK